MVCKAEDRTTPRNTRCDLRRADRTAGCGKRAVGSRSLEEVGSDRGLAADIGFAPTVNKLDNIPTSPSEVRRVVVVAVGVAVAVVGGVGEQVEERRREQRRLEARIYSRGAGGFCRPAGILRQLSVKVAVRVEWGLPSKRNSGPATEGHRHTRYRRPTYL